MLYTQFLCMKISLHMNIMVRVLGRMRLAKCMRLSKSNFTLSLQNPLPIPIHRRECIVLSKQFLSKLNLLGIFFGNSFAGQTQQLLACTFTMFIVRIFAGSFGSDPFSLGFLELNSQAMAFDQIQTDENLN